MTSRQYNLGQPLSDLAVSVLLGCVVPPGSEFLIKQFSSSESVKDGSHPRKEPLPLGRDQDGQSKFNVAGVTASVQAPAHGQVLCQLFATVRYDLVAYLRAFIEVAQTSFLNGRDVCEHILAAGVRLTETKALGLSLHLSGAIRGVD